VALRLGALCAGQHDSCRNALGQYSHALGIAYQIHDDLADFAAANPGNDLAGRRPSLILATARELAQGDALTLLDRYWTGPGRPAEIESLCRQLGAVERCESLLAEYKTATLAALGGLEPPELKRLLRQVVGRIFNEIEFDGWCADQEQRNAKKTDAPAPAP
jgi:geranylgeranyl diphosphate synthase, type II